MKILLLGGSKSGKSLFAQSLVRSLAKGGPMYYWATMEPVDGEDRARIARHLTERDGWGFATVEKGKNLREALPLAPGASVLMDSATALLANEMFAETMNPDAAEKAAAEILAVGEAVENLVCVCDDIFRDAGRYDEWTERYRKGLGTICCRLAARFDAVCEVAGGIPLVHKGDLGGLLD